MATVVNKETVRIIKGVEACRYDPDFWLINPSLSNVGNIKSEYRIIIGDTIVEMNEDEKLVVDDIEAASIRKGFHQANNTLTTTLISNGFLFNGSHFPCSPSAQIDYTGLEVLHGNGALTFPQEMSLKYDSEPPYYMNKVEWPVFKGAVFTHISVHKHYGRVMRSTIEGSSLVELKSLSDWRQDALDAGSAMIDIGVAILPP